MDAAVDDEAIVALVLARLQAVRSDAAKQQARKAALRAELQALKTWALSVGRP